MSRPSKVERGRQLRRLLRTEGPSGVAARLLTRATDALAPAGYGSLPVDRDDLVRGAEIAAGGWALPEPAPWSPGEPLTVAWVCGPAGEGSGGHTHDLPDGRRARAAAATRASSTSRTGTAGSSSSIGGRSATWWPG